MIKSFVAFEVDRQFSRWIVEFKKQYQLKDTEIEMIMEHLLIKYKEARAERDEKNGL